MHFIIFDRNTSIYYIHTLIQDIYNLKIYFCKTRKILTIFALIPGASNGNVSGSEQLQQKDLRDFRDETTGTELVVLYDYKAQAPDDLSVRRADWIYADLGNQTVDGWLWAYAPKTRKYGFIPKAYARPPAMTSL